MHRCSSWCQGSLGANSHAWWPKKAGDGLDMKQNIHELYDIMVWVYLYIYRERENINIYIYVLYYDIYCMLSWDIMYIISCQVISYHIILNVTAMFNIQSYPCTNRVRGIKLLNQKKLSKVDSMMSHFWWKFRRSNGFQSFSKDFPAKCPFPSQMLVISPALWTHWHPWGP